MPNPIFTIGHASWTLLGIIDLLKGRGITHLVDVRSSPFSKFQPDFCEKPLERSAMRAGLEYIPMGDQLGGKPPHADCHTEGRVDYGKVLQKDFFKLGITRLVSAYQQGAVICLLCAEGNPAECHRAKLLGRALADKGISVVHFLPDGATKTQTEVVAVADPLQGTLPL
jgi:uncharacterized protein (DUF488 family)